MSTPTRRTQTQDTTTQIVLVVFGLMVTIAAVLVGVATLQNRDQNDLLATGVDPQEETVSPTPGGGAAHNLSDDDSGRGESGADSAGQDGSDLDVLASGTTEDAKPGGSGTGAAGAPTETDNSSNVTQPPPTQAPPLPNPDEIGVVVPSQISASAERSPVNLYCTGEAANYIAENLIDGDFNTGWGAGQDNGTGQSVHMVLPGPTWITEIGLTPGFTKIGPRRSADCASASAFGENRFVHHVRFSFDDGTFVEFVYQQSPDIQYFPVDVITERVDMVILETVLPPGADDDTILSELVIIGALI